MKLLDSMDLIVRGANGAEAGAVAEAVPEAETEGTFASAIFPISLEFAQNLEKEEKKKSKMKIWQDARDESIQ